MTLKRFIIALGSVLALALVAGLLINQYRHPLYRAALEFEADRLNLQFKTVVADGITWSYLESNNSRSELPTLVLIHGFGADKSTWLPLAEHLKDNFHLVMPDLPGHGDSSFDASRTASLPTQASQFSHFVDAIGLQKFNIIGNSMGGGVSSVYAGTHPERLLSVILLDPLGINPYRSDFQKHLDKGENLLLVNTVADLDFLFEYAVAEKITFPWPINQVIVDNSIAKRPVLDKVFADLGSDPNYSTKDAVAKITAPTLVAWGKYDRLIAPENAPLYAQVNPAIQIKMLDTGHIPMVETPLACAQMVLEFIRQGRL